MGQDFEIEIVQGGNGETPPLFAGDAPVVSFVEEHAGVRWACKVVSRRDAGMFNVGGELGHHLALGFEAVQHAALRGNRARVKEEHFVGDLGGKELAGLHPGGVLLGRAVVIRGELQQDGGGEAFPTGAGATRREHRRRWNRGRDGRLIRMRVDDAGAKVGDGARNRRVRLRTNERRFPGRWRHTGSGPRWRCRRW